MPHGKHGHDRAYPGAVSATLFICPGLVHAAPDASSTTETARCGGFDTVECTVQPQEGEGAARRLSRCISGVTEMPCTTIEVATTLSVSAVNCSASAGGRPWAMADIR